jgi:hypothetical protein
MMEESNPPVFVVSHSNIMQCGVALFELQGRVNENINFNFDFGQNMWTMEVEVDKNGMNLVSLQDGATKPKANAARGGIDDGSYYPDTYVNDSNCANENSTVATIVGRAPRTVTNTISSMGRGALHLFTGKGGGKSYIKLDKFVNIEKPCFASAEKVKQAERLGQSIKNKKDRPRDRVPKSDPPYTFYITRHANSCNNIVPDKNISDVPYLKYKRADPSLSSFGLFTLLYKRPAMLDSLKMQREEANAEVNVSSCVRTWMTAAGIYGDNSDDLESTKLPLKLVVSPYLKEKGKDPGNVPESIPSQVQKFKGWMNANMRNAKVEVWVASPKDKTEKQQIYPRGSGSYVTEHTEYYPEGIHLFCEWMVNGKVEDNVAAATPEEQADEPANPEEQDEPPMTENPMYAGVNQPVMGGTRRKHKKSRRMKKSNRKKSRRARRSRRS